MTNIYFGVPWMKKPKTLVELVKTLNKTQRNKKIDYIYFRPADLEFKDSIHWLKLLKEERVKIYLTTSSRSGIKSIDETIEYFFQKSILPNKIIVDRHSIRQVTKNKIVQSNKIPLYISAIYGFKEKNIKELLHLKQEFPLIDSVCLHHDAIFDETLNQYAKKLTSNGITPILLANESCYKNCPYRTDHYEHLALKHEKIPDNYQNLCLEIRSKSPKTLMSISGFIHPRLIDLISERTGINHFKITGIPSRGRNRTQEESENTILSYLTGNVPSELMNIACFTYLKDKNGTFRFGLDEKVFYKYQRSLLNDNKTKPKAKGVTIKAQLTNDEKKSAKLARIAHKLNKVYSSKKNLPWTNLVLPEKIKKILNNIPKNAELHFSGCGLGELADETFKLGYKNISCSDISEVAIRKVKEKFSLLESYVIPTQQLGLTKWKKKIVFDLHNIHQVEPKDLKEYLKGIEEIAYKIILSWIYEPKRGNYTKSDVDEIGKIYHHNPKVVLDYLNPDFNLIEEGSYEYSNNPKFFTNIKIRKNNMVYLYLEAK